MLIGTQGDREPAGFAPLRLIKLERNYEEKMTRLRRGLIVIGFIGAEPRITRHGGQAADSSWMCIVLTEGHALIADRACAL